MSQRGWVGWVMANRAVSAGLAICLVLALIGIGAAATIEGDDAKDDDDDALDVATDDTTGPGDTTAPGETVPGAQPGDTTAGSQTAGTQAVVPGGGKPQARLPGQAAPSAPCSPTEVKGTGISKDEVVIGQIVSDVSFLPAQLKPANEGLQAYVTAVNKAGGVCGRKLRLEYSNDSSNPATHEYQSMAGKVFAFVGNSSLIDQVDYEEDAPFNPLHKDGGEFVPDIGGLAFSYGRNQSPYFAGNLGSLSPSLVGGGQQKFMIEKTRAEGKPCAKAGVVYLRDPNGASEDQGRLGGAGLAASWGGNFGANVKYYVANLGDPVVVYEQMAAQMVTDGVNCAFSYTDLGSTINLVKGLANRGIWPPDKCSGPQCMAIVSMAFAGYDPKFIRDAGDAARFVQTFLPHLPLNETGAKPMQEYLAALKAVRGAEPGTFSIIGWGAGQMFVTALQACGAAPTRKCVMDQARRMKDFDAGGLFGPITPFRTTKVNCSDGCGNFRGRGTYNFKHIFNCSVIVQVQDRGGKRDFFRVNPGQGYGCDTLNVARGKAA